MTDTIRAVENKRGVGVSLNESDFDQLERIREHFDLETRSQAVRKAIRITMAQLADTDSSEEPDDLVRFKAS
jgi:metal-responsive CopG/Arc/MetJ family transcriptional regulator